MTSDLWFQAQTATRRYLTPTNGAEVALLPAGTSGLQACAGSRPGLQRIDVKRLTIGRHLCLLTTDQRLSEIIILGTPSPSPGEIALSFTTWKRTNESE